MVETDDHWPRPPKPQMLPPEDSHFTGRETELARLHALLGSDSSVRPAHVVICTIAGSAGIGKTALALRWAHMVRASFPDGQLYVNLRGYDPAVPVAPEQALDGFLRVMNVAGDNIPRTVDAMAGYYRALLAGRRLLVVLDNAATPEQVRPLLPSSEGCLVLITSRSRLSGLVAREGAHRITLDLLPPAEADSLLRTIIGTSRADQEPDLTVELARRCAYLPLALRIAAERVAARPHARVADLVKDMSMAENRLDVLAADDDETTAVRTVFSWSYRSLKPPAARVFRLLGLHPGPDISVHAAAALVDLDSSTTSRLLDLLASVHLLRQTGPDRYGFHDLIRVYAAETADAEEPAGERRAAELRLLEWFLHTGVAARYALYPQIRPVRVAAPQTGVRSLSFSDRAGAVRWYDIEHDNLMVAIRHAASSGQDVIVCQLLATVSPFLSLRSRWHERIIICQIGIAAGRRANDDYGEFRSYLLLGETYLEYGQFDQVEPHICRALEIAKKTEDRWSKGQALGDLGIYELKIGRHENAVVKLREALDLLRDVGDHRGEGVMLVHLANALCGQQMFNEALECAHRALQIFRNTDNRWNEAFALGVIGAIHLASGSFDQSIDYLSQAIEAYRDSDDHHGLADTFDDLGQVFLRTGRHYEAREAWRKALRIYDDLGSPRSTRIRGYLDALNAAGVVSEGDRP